MLFKQFTYQDNVKMLWDVISDEDIFRFLTPEIQQKIYQLFVNNIQGFYESEKNKINTLVDLNKKYILVILNHIKKTYPYQPNKIKIHNEPLMRESITYEEIHNDRMSKFDRDYNKKQEDFENYMTIKPPPVPEFADKQTDSPIKEMDKILKEMQTQRNYDVEQINRINNTNEQIDNWLKPQETSLKTEKIGGSELIQNNNRFKFLNNFENESQLSPKKNVSFSNVDEIKTFKIDNNNEADDQEDTFIFSKLKKINEKNNIKLEISESNFDTRIDKLEGEIKYLNEKINKIFELLSKR